MDLTALTKLETVGTDAFSNIVGLKEVKLTEEQAQTINPGVFSGVSTDADASWGISITNGGSGSSLTFSSTAFGSSNVTLTPFSNLNRFTGVTEMDLSASPISTLEGGVLFDNSTLQTLKLPATASSWKLTDPREYKTAPVGWKTGTEKKLSNLEFSNFTLNSNTTKSKKKPKNSDPLFSQLNATTWSQVANILNMFGHMSGESKNLSIWSEGFSDPDLTADSVKSGWRKNGQEPETQLSDSLEPNQPYTKTVNGLTWTYKKDSSGTITLTVDTTGQNANKLPNLYRAGYTNNPYAYFQVGFAYF